MAVKIGNHEYFEHYQRETITFFVLVQILSAILAGGVAMATWQVLNTQPLVAFALSLIALIILNVVFSRILFKQASEPFRLLSQAVAHVSHDPVITEPPVLSAKKYERSGLKDMVQTVYELAVTSHNTPVSTRTATSSALFAEIANDMPCGLIAFSADGNIMYANSLAPVRDTSDGSKISMLQYEPTDSFENWLKTCEANKVRDTHLWQRISDRLPGEEGRRIFDVIGFYQKDNPAGIAVILVAFDRTLIYGSDQDDMDFIALAAHELRGPITVIRGYLDLIRQEFTGKFSPEQQELFDRLLVSSERLAGYINNILNVSRYDRKQFTMHLNEESLLEILKTLVPDLALRATTQHRKLTFHIPQDLPTIAADRSSIGEVITNLIDNAIKYSHENGEILISASVKDGDRVEVTVQDFGIGIPESVVGSLFNKFYRSHRSRQSVGGTGLGLYICKAIVELHGGSIWVRSVEGQGTTFGFSIPVYAAVAQKLQAGDNQNKDIVQRPEGWIKNHAMYRR